MGNIAKPLDYYFINNPSFVFCSFFPVLFSYYKLSILLIQIIHHMNFWKSSFLLALGIIVGVSGSGIINFVANNAIQDPAIPSIGSDTELVASLRRKVKELDKLTCAERYKKYEDVYKVLAENYYSDGSGVKLDKLLE